MDVTLFHKDFGYVALVGAGSSLVTFYLAMNAGRARAKYNVKPPTLYSDTEQTYNCIQRAHQNTLETYPQFLMTLFLGGIQHPRLCAFGGCVYLAGRLAFAHGYYTGDPAKRRWGGFGHIGELILLGCSVSTALHMLGVI